VPIHPLKPDDSPERLYAQARLLHDRCEEQAAVIEGIKAYIEPWKRDKGMRIMGGMLLREIERLEKAAAERTRQQKGGP
jgi:hypothetical protein